MREVYYSPGLPGTLVSLGQLLQTGHVVTFTVGEWEVRDPTGTDVLMTARPVNRVSEVRATAASGDIAAACVALSKDRSLDTWHRRLGHLNYAAVRRLADSGAVKGLRVAAGGPPVQCQTCAPSEATKYPVPQRRTSPAHIAAGVLHADLSGPVDRSIHGNEYIMVVII
ncbi:hypothetical protein PR002_g4686 [Phytophthora rubi]|nr:hypothetical protein PR002_g4686 [Phytophthora rubi]